MRRREKLQTMRRMGQMKGIQEMYEEEEEGECRRTGTEKEDE